jgi:hypothetical protein
MIGAPAQANNKLGGGGLDRMKYWVRENGAPPFHGPLGLDEVAARVKDGRFSPTCELLEAAGQSYGALKRTTGWRPARAFDLAGPDGAAGGADLLRSATGYDYRVVPLSITTESVGSEAHVAAERVGRVVAQMAAEGWDFYRIDAVGVEVRPGCLGAILGQTSAERSCSLAIFRRPSAVVGHAPHQRVVIGPQ